MSGEPLQVLRFGGALRGVSLAPPPSAAATAAAADAAEAADAGVPLRQLFVADAGHRPIHALRVLV